MEAYVGLDAHSKRSVFVIANAQGEVIGRGDVPTTPAGLATLRTEHQLAAGTPVALESRTVAFFVAREVGPFTRTMKRYYRLKPVRRR